MSHVISDGVECRVGGVKTMAAGRRIEELFIEITNYCLQRCIHCSSNADCNRYAEISFANIQDTVQRLLPMGLQSVILSGGEPFLHPDLFAIVDFLKSNELRYSLYTCGVICGPERPASIPDEVFYRIKDNRL